MFFSEEYMREQKENGVKRIRGVRLWERNIELT
jgi:hypothetical protein